MVQDFWVTGQAGARLPAPQGPPMAKLRAPAWHLWLGPCQLAHLATQTLMPLQVTFATEQPHPRPQRAPDPIPHCTEGTQRGREHPRDTMILEWK